MVVTRLFQYFPMYLKRNQTGGFPELILRESISNEEVKHLLQKDLIIGIEENLCPLVEEILNLDFSKLYEEHRYAFMNKKQLIGYLFHAFARILRDSNKYAARSSKPDEIVVCISDVKRDLMTYLSESFNILRSYPQVYIRTEAWYNYSRLVDGNDDDRNFPIEFVVNTGMDYYLRYIVKFRKNDYDTAYPSNSPEWPFFYLSEDNEDGSDNGMSDLSSWYYESD